MSSMTVMIAAMLLMRGVDQEDPAVLMRVRLAYAAYLAVTAIIYAILHFRITRRKDLTKLTVPVPKNPMSTEENQPTEREITVLEYDLEILNSARKGWLMNTVILTLIHYKMETVSPLIMSPIMAFVKLVTEDPLVKLHILGKPAVDKLKRPFAPEENPLAALLKGLAPKQENEQNEPEGEELHEESESDDDDDAPPAIADLTDDHLEGDFDDAKEPKKTK